MPDSVDYLISRLGDEAACARQGDVILVERWGDESFQPPLRLFLSAAQLDRIVPKLAELAVGAWTDSDEVDPDDGWKLLIVHLHEDIDTKSYRDNELHPEYA